MAAYRDSPAPVPFHVHRAKIPALVYSWQRSRLDSDASVKATSVKWTAKGRSCSAVCIKWPRDYLFGLVNPRSQNESDSRYDWTKWNYDKVSVYIKFCIYDELLFNYKINTLPVSVYLIPEHLSLLVFIILRGHCVFCTVALVSVLQLDPRETSFILIRNYADNESSCTWTFLCTV